MRTQAIDGDAISARKKTRKDSVKKFVFSCSHNETQTTGRDVNPSAHRRQRTRSKSNGEKLSMRRPLMCFVQSDHFERIYKNCVTHQDVLFLEHAFLDRYGRSEHILNHPQDERICFIHNHKIVRAVKVYINVYHLWQSWVNRKQSYRTLKRWYWILFLSGALRSVGLGGGYHTSIEVFGREFHFGCCSQIDAGIFESVPLHQIQRCRAADNNSPKNATIGVFLSAHG